MVFLEENSIDAQKVKMGDTVECIYSSIERRIGKRWVVIGGQGRPTEKTAPLWWLKHCASYGDKYKKLQFDQK